MRLYDLPNELETLMTRYEALLETTIGEITPEVEALEKEIADYLAAGEQKIESAACVIKNLEADAKAASEEAKRLANRSNSIYNNVDRLKELTRVAVTAMGGKVKTARFSIYVQDNPPSYTIAVLAPGTESLLDIAKDYPQFVKVTAELRKAELIVAQKEGKELPPEVTLVQNPVTTSLRIK